MRVLLSGKPGAVHWLLKGENLLVRIAGVASAIMALYVFWHFVLHRAAPPDLTPSARAPNVTACDSRAEPMAKRIVGSLFRLDCTLSEIRVCDFEETALSAEETSHGMPSHMMRISVEVDGERLPIIGNGRGAQAAKTAFDSLFNNLRLALEDRNLCR